MTNQEMLSKLQTVMTADELREALLVENVGKGSSLRNRIKRLYNEHFGMVNNFDDIYQKYNGFIHKISIEFSKRYNMDKDDVYQECIIGLLEATKTKTTKPITYLYLVKVMRNNVLRRLLALKKQQDRETVDIFDPTYINKFYTEDDPFDDDTDEVKERMELLKKYLTKEEITLMLILVQNGRDGTQTYNSKIQKLKEKMRLKGDLK